MTRINERVNKVHAERKINVLGGETEGPVL
jgi:hypothetical protein